MRIVRETKVIEHGTELGVVIAVVISWSLNKSILWCIFHGICSWFYVLYFVWFIR